MSIASGWLCCINSVGRSWLLHVYSSGDLEDVEQLVDETHLVLHVRLAREAMASADHPHHLEALDRSGRRLHCLKAAGRPDHSFEGAVVCFDDVIEVLARAMPCIGRQPAFPLQPNDGFGVGAELVGGDRGWRPVAHRC